MTAAPGGASLPARILIVKLSSLGDVVHAMPVVHDIRTARPGAVIDWVVEPAFAPVLGRVRGLAEVIGCPLRAWRRAFWSRGVRREAGAFAARLRRHRYDAVLDLQGLTKSAVVARLARGVRYAVANRTEGAGYEPPASWLADRTIRIEPHTHAVDCSRQLAARALGYEVSGAPDFGLQPPTAATRPSRGGAAPTLLFVHGSSRDDKLWPESHWIELGRRAIATGWRIALPQAGAAEALRAARIAHALGDAAGVWPALDLGGVVARMAAVDGVVGVDSGLSHIAVALGLAHVQLYNHPTSWRTGPQPGHGHRHQLTLEGRPAPDVDSVWAAWQRVTEPAAA